MAFNPRAPAGHLICRHLRCKEMFYESLVQPATAGETADPELQEFNRYYWCLKSFREVSPDGESCSADDCSPARSCYEK